MEFRKERLDPIEHLKQFGWPCDHITYDPKLRKGDYSIIRGSTHDGTQIFEWELIKEPLGLLAFKESFHKPFEKEFDAGRDGVRYVVGPLRLASVFGYFKLPCSETNKYRGMRQRSRIPVRVVYPQPPSTPVDKP